MTTILNNLNNAILAHRSKKFWSDEYKTHMEQAELSKLAAQHEIFAVEHLAWMSPDPLYAASHARMAQTCLDHARKELEEAEGAKYMLSAF